MRRLQAIIATTEVDSQGERMSREALEGLVESFSRSYVPIGIQHDPRIPPQGRVSSGFVRERPNGEFEAVATMELFEDCEPYVGSDTRELLPMRPNVAGLTVSYDWTHRSDEDQSDISAIAAVFGNDAQYDIKKAAEPISIITIAGAFALGGIATGFLSQIGVDGWSVVKKRLASLFSRTQSRTGEQLLVFSALTRANGSDVEIEIVLTNPTPDDVEQFLAAGLQAAETALPDCLSDSPSLRRIVFEAKGDQIELKFGVRKDCRVLVPRAGIKGVVKRPRSS